MMMGESPLRQEWLAAVARELQVAAVTSGSPSARVGILRQLLPRLPPPSSGLEQLVLDGLIFRALRTVFPACQPTIPQHAEPFNSSRLDAARRILDAEYSQQITIAHVAREVGMSCRALSRDFTRAYGLTPHHYLARTRSAAVVEILTTTSTKTERIHTLVGYRSRSTLYREFARAYRTTPGAFRSDLRASSAQSAT